jgi:hypothetical protein
MQAKIHNVDFGLHFLLPRMLFKIEIQEKQYSGDNINGKIQQLEP